LISSKYIPAISPKIIIINTASTITTPRIAKDKAIYNFTKCAATSNKKKSVLLEIVVQAHIPLSNNTIAIINIRNNSVLISLILLKTVLMEIFAHMPTHKNKF
jgi:hypothetical protein